jgi:excisionase family DNA binding protein
MEHTLYLNPQQLCQRWAMHPESIRRMVRKKRLPGLRIGKSIRIAKADIEAFEAKHKIVNFNGGTN